MNILVAIDFSDVTRQLINQTALVAERSSNIWLVHVVVGDAEFGGYLAGRHIVHDQQYLKQKFPAYQQKLEDSVKELQRRNVNAETVLMQGPTDEAILSEAERRKANLIVIGSQGHGSVYTLLLGSVSAGVLKGASCPLLVVPISVLARHCMRSADAQRFSNN